MGDWSAFLCASEKPEKQGARLLRTGQMEPEWAKNRHRRVLPVDTAGLMGDPRSSRFLAVNQVFPFWPGLSAVTAWLKNSGNSHWRKLVRRLRVGSEGISGPGQ